VIPLLVAILITALVWPALSWLLRHGVPRWASITLTLIGTLAIVAGLVWLVAWQISREAGGVRDRVVVAVEDLRAFLLTLGVSESEINTYIDQGLGMLQEQSGMLWSGALALGSTVGHVAAGALLTLFALICILADGGSIWGWTVRLFPAEARRAVDVAARNGSSTTRTPSSWSPRSTRSASVSVPSSCSCRSRSPSPSWCSSAPSCRSSARS